MGLHGVLDSSLAFIQDNFNVDSKGYFDIIKTLEVLATELRNDTGTRKDNRATKAIDLLARRKEVAIIKDDKLFSRIEDITSKIDLTSSGIKQAIRMCNELINDIDNTREWLKEYEDLVRHASIGSMDRLIALGKAILGRAVELCPIDTGLLRASGVLIVYGDYIVIAFAAPYATYVHENMENYHDVGVAKYLERALQEFFPNRRVWIETHESHSVMVKLTLNNNIEYKHNMTGRW